MVIFPFTSWACPGRVISARDISGHNYRLGLQRLRVQSYGLHRLSNGSLYLLHPGLSEPGSLPPSAARAHRATHCVQHDRHRGQPWHDIHWSSEETQLYWYPALPWHAIDRRRNWGVSSRFHVYEMAWKSFRITGPLWGGSIGHRWIAITNF